jgi:hypothetical protein
MVLSLFENGKVSIRALSQRSLWKEITFGGWVTDWMLLVPS